MPVCKARMRVHMGTDTRANKCVSESACICESVCELHAPEQDTTMLCLHRF